MTKKDDTYQNSKVSLIQDADTLTFDSDGIMDFFGSEITGENLKAMLYAKLQYQVIANSAGAGSGVLSTLVVPSYIGLVIYSIGDAASNASGTLPGCLAGQEMILITRGAGSTGSIRLSVPTGVSVYGLMSNTLSVIALNNSAGSQAYVHLKAIADDTWAVTNINYLTVTLAADA